MGSHFETPLLENNMYKKKTCSCCKGKGQIVVGTQADGSDQYTYCPVAGCVDGKVCSRCNGDLEVDILHHGQYLAGGVCSQCKGVPPTKED